MRDKNKLSLSYQEQLEIGKLLANITSCEALDNACKSLCISKEEAAECVSKFQCKSGKDGWLNAGLAGASLETVQRYGSAVKEHLVAYSGVDNETGRILKRSLKSIADYKVNPDYEKQNIKQQAGFSAEVKETANYNANEIIKGSKNRKIRTDDLGRVNDEYYDHVVIDGNGNIVKGSESQMKFVGSNPENALEKLASAKFEKYLDKNAKIEVPSDYYDSIQQCADEKIAALEVQQQRLKADGKLAETEKIGEQIKKYKKIKRNLRKSSVSNEQANSARLNPKLSTARSIAEISHKAGIEGAKYGAAIGGSVALVQNCVALAKGDCDFKEAAKNVAISTAESAASGYALNFTGSALKGVMQNSTSSTLRSLSATNLPATVVAFAFNAKDTVIQYFKGNIDGTQCLVQLGQNGTNMLSSGVFAVVGQTAIPIPVIGGLIGSMVGYAISTASYGALTQALTEAKLAREERMRIEAECEEHIRLIKQYRSEMEKVIGQYLKKQKDTFYSAFVGIKNSLEIGDVDGFISSVNSITEFCGKKALYNNMSEFDKLMLSNNTIKF